MVSRASAGRKTKGPRKGEQPVKPSTPEFAAAARDALEAVLAKGAIAVAIVYETSDRVGHVAVPNSSAVALGLIGMEAERITS